ncbi:MAG: hypothetical protein ACI4Q4_06300, partial [Oscillospiraceae bacterium]
DDCNGSIYINHDPFVKGEDLEDYLKEYSHDKSCSKGTMILNIKSERIEHKVLELIGKYGVEKYFFLDSSFPMIKLLSDGGEKNIALRFSEYEGLDTVLAMKNKVDWVWVDCFTVFPLDKKIYSEIKSCGYKICIVSPELQGQPEKLEEYGQYMKENGLIPDAVCTKLGNIGKWKKIFG